MLPKMNGFILLMGESLSGGGGRGEVEFLTMGDLDGRKLCYMILLL